VTIHHQHHIFKELLKEGTLVISLLSVSSVTPEGMEHSWLQHITPLIGNWCLNKLAAIKSSPMKIYFQRCQSKSLIPA